MEFDEFKMQLLLLLRDMGGKEWTINSHRIEKNNGVVMESVTMLRKGGKIAPAIYLDDFYNWYKSGTQMEEIAKTIFIMGKEGALKEDAVGVNLQDYKKVRPHICYKLVNFKMNRAFLKQVPFYRYLDLAIVFYYRMEDAPFAGAAFLIHTSNLEEWGITKKQLYQDAHENTFRKLPYQFQGMEELIRQMTGEGMAEGMADAAEEHMYVLTNQEKYFGAAVLLYPHVLSHISSMMGGNFFVLPSSIHECILVPDSGQYSKSELTVMVNEVNETQVDEEEILSGRVYYYDADKNELV